jgi:MFS family permease
VSAPGRKVTTIVPVTFADVLRNREFRALWLADIQSWAGDQVARVALSVLVFDRTDSAFLTAAIYCLTYLPEIVGGAWLPGLADRYPRRTVMVICDLLRAVLVGAMALPQVPIGVICALLVLAILAGRPFRAAEGAILPDILSDESYVVASGLRMMTDQLAQIAGFALGGVAIAAIGTRAGLAVDAVTYLVSAVLIAGFLKHRPAPDLPADDAEQARVGSIWSVAKYVANEPTMRALVPLGWLAAFFIAPEGLAAAYAATVGGGAVRTGLLLCSIATGCAVGSYLVVRLIPTSRQPELIGPLAIATGIPLLICAFRPGLVLSLALWCVSGALSAYQVPAFARLIRLVPPHLRGKIIGVIGSGLISIQGLGVLLIGALASGIGAPAAVAVAGAIGSGLAIPLTLWWGRIRRLDDATYRPRHRSPGEIAKHRDAAARRAVSSPVSPDVM